MEVLQTNYCFDDVTMCFSKVRAMEIQMMK